MQKIDLLPQLRFWLVIHPKDDNPHDVPIEEWDAHARLYKHGPFRTFNMMAIHMFNLLRNFSFGQQAMVVAVYVGVEGGRMEVARWGPFTEEHVYGKGMTDFVPWLVKGLKTNVENRKLVNRVTSRKER